MRARRLGSFALAGCLVLLASSSALALDSTAARGRAELAIKGSEADALRASKLAQVRYQPPTPAQRVAAGDMLLRNRDYDQAIITLNKVLELHRQGKMPEQALADATFLLGEAYFQSHQYLAARRHYREVLDKADQAPFTAYAGRSVSRLVDIALRTDDLESLDYVFARLDKLPANDSTGSIPYARAKALFAKRDYAAAKSSINSVPANSDYTLQSQYLLGVIFIREATPVVAPPADAPVAPGAAPVAPPPAPDAGRRYAAAIEQFRRVTRMPATTPAAKQVVDVAWMAIGRLFYETESYLEAAEAYSHVDRQSPEFSAMLHELAWVYVRLGDYQRAQRALEVLTITDPNNLDIADGSLLRADLMLRSGQFDKALSLYKSVHGRFDPIRDQVDRFMVSNSDPAVYYDKLTADPDLPSGKDVPPIALEWAREQAEDEHVFALIDDANRSRDLIGKSRRLALRLNAVLAVPTRAKAFPETRAALEGTLSVLNRVARARVTLAEGLDEEADEVNGELMTVRRERRALMARMNDAPVSPSDFARRDEAGDRQWNRASQALQRLTVESDKLRAIVNGLRRVLSENAGFEIKADAAARARFQLELEANERDLEGYQRRIQEYRDAIEMGRVQSGFGDQRFVDDDQVRKRFKELFAREVALVASGQDDSDAVEYARSIQPLLARADVVDQRVAGLKEEIERTAVRQAEELRRKIDDEVALLETYAKSLEGLDGEARLVVGEVAMKNFALVRDRLKSIVLRADVGIVQEAWEVREEQRLRVRNLQRQRAREEQNLNDELREVLDDAEDDL
jgi:tetratricopeptide (TPR) repeat protein